jgi:hypothetical protein
MAEPRVVLLIYPHAAYDSALLRGTMRYSREHGPWVFYLSWEYPGLPLAMFEALNAHEERISLQRTTDVQSRVRLPDFGEWSATGVLGRLQTPAIVEQVMRSRLPTAALNLSRNQLARGSKISKISEIKADSHDAGHPVLTGFPEGFAKPIDVEWWFKDVNAIGGGSPLHFCHVLRPRTDRLVRPLATIRHGPYAAHYKDSVEQSSFGAQPHGLGADCGHRAKHGRLRSSDCPRDHARLAPATGQVLPDGIGLPIDCYERFQFMSSFTWFPPLSSFVTQWQKKSALRLSLVFRSISDVASRGREPPSEFVRPGFHRLHRSSCPQCPTAWLRQTRFDECKSRIDFCLRLPQVQRMLFSEHYDDGHFKGCYLLTGIT